MSSTYVIIIMNAIEWQVFHQLDEGHKKEQEELSQELLEVKVSVSSHCLNNFGFNE